MNDVVRVLHVFSEMVLEGAESRIMDLYRNMDTEKVQFDFAVHKQVTSYFDEEIRQRGGRIYVWPEFRLRTLFRYVRTVDHFFKAHPEYKIVHGHLTSFGFVYQLIAKKNGLKTRIAHARSSSAERNLKGCIARMMVKPLKYCVTHCFACSIPAGEYVYGKKYMRKGKVRIINNAIDARKFSFSSEDREAVRNELGLKNKFVVGHVGTFRYAKNHQFLLDIFAEMEKTRKDAVLLLVGDGKLKDEIIAQAKRLGIFNQIVFAGQRSDVPAMLSSMDVFVFPSHYEGLPGAVIEAQASGLRCFVSDAISKEAGITELVAFISLKEKAGFWAEKINENTSSMREDMSYKIASAGFDVNTAAEELQRFYLDIK